MFVSFCLESSPFISLVSLIDVKPLHHPFRIVIPFLFFSLTCLCKGYSHHYAVFFFYQILSTTVKQRSKHRDQHDDTTG